ncbi:MAG: response regulator, partial [Pseudomonadota bacterium]|nr:response regulator [Pseudomonadota bacterium]
MKCLLVEDDQALARELSQALQDGDWIVERAENGQEADFLVRTEAYDTVILDIGLPDGDGTRWLSSWR